LARQIEDVFATDQDDRGVTLGRVPYRSDERPFGLAVEDRRRHLNVVGRTSVGKTMLLENLIRLDIAAGRGVCLIDPHVDLAQTVLASIPTHRTNDVIVFDPSDLEQAIAFNPLACRDSWEDRVRSGVVTSFKKFYDSWGPRLEDINDGDERSSSYHSSTHFQLSIASYSPPHGQFITMPGGRTELHLLHIQVGGSSSFCPQ